MSLINLLTDSKVFHIGRVGGVDQNGQPIYIPNYNLSYNSPKGSKQIKYPDTNPGGGSGTPFINRVSFDYQDKDASPTFEIGTDHNNGDIQDFIYRGGTSAFFNRVDIDYQRILAFLEDKGGQYGLSGNRFLQRQAALQLLNPQKNTRTFNDGISLKAQIRAGGQTRFKRHGLIPEPADVNVNNFLGNLMGDSRLGKFMSNVIGGDYVNSIGKRKIRENKYRTGDPGQPHRLDLLQKLTGFTNPFKKKGYNVSLKKTLKANNLDVVNFQSIIKTTGGALPPELEGISVYTKDFIPFRFEVIDSDVTVESYYIIFRAFLDNMSDNYSATHNEIKYNGRGEPFYTYNKFGRDIQLSFKIAAQTRHEMKPIYQKLNFLAAQTAPNYSATGRIRTPYMKLTVGDYFNRVPGVLANVNITWQKDYTWEIKNDIEQDGDMLILPHVLDVSVSFKPIHDFTPNNKPGSSPFISIDGGLGSEGVSTATTPNWMSNTFKDVTTFIGDNGEFAKPQNANDGKKED